VPPRPSAPWVIRWPSRKWHPVVQPFAAQQVPPNESSAPTPLCHGPARVSTGLRLHGCTQLPAGVVILRSQSGRHGSRPVARLASSRSPILYSDCADRRRHLRHRVRRPQSRAGWDPPPPLLPAAAAGRAQCQPPGPRWVAWRVGLTADRFRVTWLAGRAPPSLILGVSWAARWCAGSPQLCTSLSAEPVGQSAGSCGWGAAAGPVLPRVNHQRGRLGRGAQPQVRNSDRHSGRSTGTVSQGQSSAEACSPPRSAVSGLIATEARVTPRTG
jgi:hypothetical protein